MSNLFLVVVEEVCDGLKPLLQTQHLGAREVAKLLQTLLVTRSHSHQGQVGVHFIDALCQDPS